MPLTEGFACCTPATIAPTVTVLKYGIDVTSGTVATTPFAPLAVRVLINKLYNSAKVVSSVNTSPAPPDVAYNKASLLPSQFEKKVNGLAVIKLRYGVEFV